MDIKLEIIKFLIEHSKEECTLKNMAQSLYKRPAILDANLIYLQSNDIVKCSRKENSYYYTLNIK